MQASSCGRDNKRAKVLLLWLLREETSCVCGLARTFIKYGNIHSVGSYDSHTMVDSTNFKLSYIKKWLQGSLLKTTWNILILLCSDLCCRLSTWSHLRKKNIPEGINELFRWLRKTLYEESKQKEILLFCQIRSYVILCQLYCKKYLDRLLNFVDWVVHM